MTSPEPLLVPSVSPRGRPAPLQTPCINCRSKHLRCTYETDQCEPCKRHSWTCVRRNPRKNPIQFRPGSRAKYDQAFAPDQVWVKLGRRSVRLRFIDETVDVISGYNSASDSENEGIDGEEGSFRTGAAVGTQSEAAQSHALGAINSTKNAAHGGTHRQTTTVPAMTTLGSSDTATVHRGADIEPPTSQGRMHRPVVFVGDTDIRLQAILLRYFAEVIGPRFDLCDNERHFSRLVPQRARSSPTLLNAILTTSARHLTRLQRYRNSAGIVEWQGHLLPNLSEESAVYYHNECIKDLLRLSMDPEQIHNEALLAAAIILRTDEEMDAPLHEGEEDTEVFLGMLNMFINAQVPLVATLPHSSPPVYPSQEDLYGPGVHLVHAPQPDSPSHPLSSPAPQTNILWPYAIPHVPRPDGLRQAAFWVALRQELFTSFMKQRPLNFPMSHCDAFRNLSPAEDVIWADRLVIFCADLLEYCYGSSYLHTADQTSHRRHDPSRWHELRNYERDLTLALPKSFEPMCYREPDTSSGQVFPEIWHLESCHVTGTTHLELARILLVAFDQSRPTLGPGSVSSQRKLASTLKDIVRRLCGIAMCNRQSPPAFIEALMGITLCGEYFTERGEQEALLGVLRTMRQEHAFPTGKVEKMLLDAWGWDSLNS